MIKINLLEQPKEKETRATALKTAPPVSSMLIVGVVILAIGVLVVAIWWWTVHAKLVKSRTDLEEAKAERERLKPFIEEVAKYEAKKNLWAAKRDAIDLLRKNRNMPVHLLDEITKSLPQFLWLEDVNKRGDIIEFRGSCTNKLDPSTFVGNLEASEFFSDVRLTSVDLVQTPAGEAYTFNISAKIVNPFQQKAKTETNSTS
jgi:type IV pilus assembly protein PilN